MKAIQNFMVVNFQIFYFQRSQLTTSNYLYSTTSQHMKYIISQLNLIP